MSTQTTPETIVYPDSDGRPMADNTLQFKWIVTIVGGLQRLFMTRDDVFIAGDLLWYPVEGKNKLCTAPDAMVIFGRPKGDRGSYQQWREDGIAPHVVFEVLSPNNRAHETVRKYRFYDRYGVEEYYIYDPDTFELVGYVRSGRRLKNIHNLGQWVSPRLAIRFDRSGRELRIIGPDGVPFGTYEELAAERDREHQRAEALAAQLRAMGIEPQA